MLPMQLKIFITRYFRFPATGARARSLNEVIKDQHMTKQYLSLASRRGFIFDGGTVLSATGVALLAGKPAFAAKHAGSNNAAHDAAVLNTALALEYEGINAYTLAAQSNLLEKKVLVVATKFQDDHKAHRDRLIATIKTLGASPVSEKSLAEYAQELEIGKLKSQADVLDFASGLERGAVNAYLGIIPSFADRGLAKLAGQLATDEREHFTVLTQALGRPLPAPVTFGV
jgi:rubrerythrin